MYVYVYVYMYMYMCMCVCVRVTHPEPFVDTFSVELVAAGQDPQQLARLKVAHAHHTPAHREH